ncbi:MAG: hypothetical protein CMR00_04035 [[Chlorobium] sp. 445]|nr:MAG: hypothetical protein CMR00_04035 [[Chlorobium] sp. 445]
MSKKMNEADTFVQKAEDGFAKIDALNAAVLELWAHEPLRALSAAEEACKQAKVENYLSGQAYSLRNMGICHWRLANYDKALEALKEALAIFKELEDYEGSITVLHNLSIVHRQLGDTHKRSSMRSVV